MKEAKSLINNQVEVGLLENDAEGKLYRVFSSLENQAKGQIEAKNYLGFLQGMLAMKEPIDDFFNNVMVMTDNMLVRQNRLALLQQISNLFARIAQFNQLQL